MDTTKPFARFPSEPLTFVVPALACSPADLAAQLRSADAPLLIDVRKSQVFETTSHALRP